MSKKLLILALLCLGLTGCTQERFGAFGDPFLSLQVGSSPTNGYILQTDGTNSTWVENLGSAELSLTSTSTDIFGNSLLGAGTFKTATGTPFSLYVGDGLVVENTATTSALYITEVAANSWLATDSNKRVIATSTQPISEVPTGTVNGSNVTFTLTGVPADSDDLIVSVNGQVQRNGTDFTLSGNTITYTTAPETGWTHFAHYQSFPSGLQFGLLTSVVNETSNYTVTNNNGTILVDASSGNVTVTLPSAVGLSGKIFVIKKTDSSGFQVIVDGDGSETIDGATTATITSQYESITIISNNSNWFIL